MPLDPQDIAAAGDAYLEKLIDSAEVRAELAAAKTHAEIAKHIASVVGMNVTEVDVAAIAAHLNANRSSECEQLATQYPALLGVVEKSG